MTAPERAPLGAALALLMTVTSLAGSLSPVLVAVIVGALSLMIAVGWTELLELPDSLGSRIVIGGTGIAGATLTLLGGGSQTPLRGVAFVAAGGVFAAFVQQMLRKDRRSLTLSLTGTVGGLMLVALSCCWTLAAAEAASHGTLGMLTAASAGLAAALLLAEAPLGGRLRLVLGLIASIAVTALVATSFGATTLLAPALLGLILALGAIGAHQLLASTLVSREPMASLAVAAAPVGTIGVAVLIAVRILAP